MTVTGEPVDLTVPEWLEVDPSTGTVPARSSQAVSVTVDAAGLAPGEYTANLGFASNDPDTPLAVVPVTVEVLDACPDGFPADENIRFGDRDSGVPNYDRGDGCTFLDLVWAEAPFANHGGFVRTVAELVHQWRDDGRFTGREARAVLVAAVRSDVGRPTALIPGLNTVT